MKEAKLNESKISPFIMLLLILSILVFSFVYYLIGINFVGSQLSYKQYLMLCVLVVLVVSGGYQLYFWTQNNSDYFPMINLKTKLDDYIPFWPWWIWIYSLLYYIVIGLVIVSLKTIDQMLGVIFAGSLLLFFQCLLFIVLPSSVPKSWRDFKSDTASKRLLKLVQSFDQENNCFPSMHCSMAMFVSMLLLPSFGYWVFVFPVLIALSCVFTKQHMIMDILPGLFLGRLVFVLVL